MRSCFLLLSFAKNQFQSNWKKSIKNDDCIAWCESNLLFSPIFLINWYSNIDFSFIIVLDFFPRIGLLIPLRMEVLNYKVYKNKFNFSSWRIRKGWEWKTKFKTLLLLSFFCFTNLFTSNFIFHVLHFIAIPSSISYKATLSKVSPSWILMLLFSRSILERKWEMKIG